MIPRRIARILHATAVCAITLTTAQACGPDFFPDVFVRTNRPDLPERYVQGHLGILQTDFPSADLFVAYRYLNGGTLTADEQKGWAPSYSVAEQTYGEPPIRYHYEEPKPNPAIANWAATRARFTNIALANVDPDLQKKVTTPDGYRFEVTVPNCADDAFRTAVVTLQSRAATWGKSSPVLADWIQAQDSVFVNCSGGNGTTPKPAPSGSPLLLQQDRAYQIAAAHFYVGNLEAATREFDAIAADVASPWKAIAGYVGGRVRLRNAANDSPTGFNRSSLEDAERHIDRYLATEPLKQWAEAAKMQRNLIRIRLEPEVRTHELTALLSGPGEDWNYQQDVQDVLWLMRAKVPDNLRAEPEHWEEVKTTDGKIDYRTLSPSEAHARAVVLWDKAFADSASFRASAPILDWTITLRAYSAQAAPHALQQWKQTRTLPWLVAALMLSPDNTPQDAALLQAAMEVPISSPAWQTVRYHLARLQLASDQLSAARATIATLQQAQNITPLKEQEPSTQNALRSLAMRAATTREDSFAHLPRTILLAASETSCSSDECKEVMTHRSNWHRCLTPGQQQMDANTARFLNEQAPLSVWVEAANSSSIPQPLRQSIAMQGWTRATLLGDTVAAASLQPLLPQSLQQQLAVKSPLTPWLVLARNPGLQPNVDPGTQRAYSYDFVESYRLNWQYNAPEFATPLLAPPAWMTPQELQRGRADAVKLQSIRAAEVGRKIIVTVRSNPHDTQAPQALYYILRMIRYGGNLENEPSQQSGVYRADNPTAASVDQLGRDAAALMRRYFATSTWTKKAAPFVGEVHPPKP
ncbi:hypothetical protein [Terriglobus sp. TAA 43]|uniref:hypothetical protein n=1 Tax=Terriglobus sp. TAA 43 TaxID=278961 RepID=UPI000648D727|nr:hypothetical protein [Terriglobus sp. TAA 43]